MKKSNKSNLFKMLGPLIYVLTYVINKYVIELPNIIYIPILIIAIIFLIIGILLSI